jgi:polysaccharide export outer membrane protein
MVLGRLAMTLVIGVAALLASMGSAQTTDQGYRVKPGDTLQISVWGEPDLQGPVLVAPDGTFSFPLVGHVDARSKTTDEIQEVVAKKLATFLTNPVATVTITEVNGNKVYVLGQVARPGAFVMNPALDVLQALSMAGGTTPFAALDDIRILRRSPNGQVALPFRYQAVVRGRNLEDNIQLQSGDVVVVP